MPLPLFRQQFLYICIAVILCSSFYSTAKAYTQAPEALILTSFTLSTQNNNLVIDTSIDIDSRVGLRNMLRDGAQILLSCQSTLERSRTLLPAETLAEVTTEVFLRHDPLTRTFIASSNQNGKSIQSKDFTTVFNATLGKLSIPLYPSELLIPNEDYRVTIDVELRHAEVPPWLSHTLFFWSWEIVPPLSFSQDFLF